MHQQTPGAAASLPAMLPAAPRCVPCLRPGLTCRAEVDAAEWVLCILDRTCDQAVPC